MEDWRLEPSRGGDAVRAKMNQALSYARFETTCEKLLDQCLLYLPDDLVPFLLELLRKQLVSFELLCQLPSRRFLPGSCPHTVSARGTPSKVLSYHQAVQN